MSRLSFDLDALKADAGAMYDVLSQIVDFHDQKRIRGDVGVRRDEGSPAWLIDELARDLVEKHADKQVAS